jgi:hypothetical protein
MNENGSPLDLMAVLSSLLARLEVLEAYSLL